MTPHRTLTALITITGQVQGIGFRPFVYRLAQKLSIKGSITNTKKGVKIVAQGKNLKKFIHLLCTEPPPLSRYHSFVVSYSKSNCYDKFTITQSDVKSKKSAVFVLPDLALCSDCQKELFAPDDRRFGYPFINCTHCGPRYTIIKALPYDRERTTMSKFNLCPDCFEEYHNPTNRRFHAEPLACPKCGPTLTLLDKQGKPLSQDPITAAAQALLKGKIVAIKGLGGFHLACDATSDRAVKLLRQRKERSGKPFAVMVENSSVARQFCRLNRSALNALNSAAAPIVLAPKLPNPRIPLSPFVAPNNPAFGVMVAYTPLHRLLFQALRQRSGKPAVLVMTSANQSDEPIVGTDEELKRKLGKVFDLAITHNREIANRCDDSVVLADQKKTVMVRRARGYAPQPITVDKMFHVKQETLAVGGDGRNTFCLARGGNLFLSPHIGDLDSIDSERFFSETLERLIEWTGIVPKRVICDLHPDYSSTRLAERLSKRWDGKIYRVQHHYAHILSVIAEHGLKPPVIGLACDGTGYGIDGAVWGCEIILVQPDLSWKRLAHLGYLRHNAGGGMLADPEKVAVAYCAQAGLSASEVRALGLKPSRGEPDFPFLTSSMGRLFDCVAAITGICRRATFEGEAAIALEKAALDAGRLKVKAPEFGLDLNPVPILRWVAEHTIRHTPAQQVALGFHTALVHGLGEALTKFARAYRINQVCLSGGSIQNRLIRNGIVKFLARQGVAVYHNEAVPLNDGGIALGQAIVPTN
ncbi:carbamoyltransferase HypF [candidate division WOR-3 bacterium]|nr:carbamoyltransferase HypF [candidate division WOR-3 bacterium]